MDDGFNRVPHENRRVIHDGIINSFREIFLQLFHLRANVFGKFQRVRAGRLENRDGHRRFVVQQRAQAITARAEFDARDVFQQSFFAVRAGLDDDVAEFFFGNEPAFHVDLQFKIHR